MNLIDLFTDVLPIFSALLSLIASIITLVFTKRINKKKDDVNKVTLKLNNKKINVDGYSEEELMKILSNVMKEEKLQKEQFCKTETENTSKN